MTSSPDDQEPTRDPGPTERPGDARGYTVTYWGTVAADWIDANEHMNVSWYDSLFDIAEMRFFDAFGIDDAYIHRTGLSFFRLERFVLYERELLVGDTVEARSRVLWSDFRRVHHFHELWNIEKGYRAALVDAISIHVDLGKRKSARIEMPEIRQPLETLLAEHTARPFPEGVLTREAGRRLQP